MWVKQPQPHIARLSSQVLMPVCTAPLSHGKGVVWAQQGYWYCIHVPEDTEAQQDITCQGHTATCGGTRIEPSRVLWSPGSFRCDTFSQQGDEMGLRPAGEGQQTTEGWGYARPAFWAASHDWGLSSGLSPSRLCWAALHPNHTALLDRAEVVLLLTAILSFLLESLCEFWEGTLDSANINQL